MPFEIGTHVYIWSRAAIVHGITGSHGLTGTIDEIDSSAMPYHVVFDTPRDGVESLWFEEGELLPAPRYIHDCGECEYLGQYDTQEHGKTDLYWCIKGNVPTSIARYGDGEANTMKYIPVSRFVFEQYYDLPIHEAYRRAREIGYPVGHLR